MASGRWRFPLPCPCHHKEHYSCASLVARVACVLASDGTVGKAMRPQPPRCLPWARSTFATAGRCCSCLEAQPPHQCLRTCVTKNLLLPEEIRSQSDRPLGVPRLVSKVVGPHLGGTYCEFDSCCDSCSPNRWHLDLQLLHGVQSPDGSRLCHQPLAFLPKFDRQT